MTNEETIAGMWEAYKAGAEQRNVRLSYVTEINYDTYRKDFNKWLKLNFAELLEEPKPTIPRYWHEFGCHARSTTPNRTGECHCDGKEPER